jgi:hypothetical protein
MGAADYWARAAHSSYLAGGPGLAAELRGHAGRGRGRGCRCPPGAPRVSRAAVRARSRPIGARTRDRTTRLAAGRETPGPPARPPALLSDLRLELPIRTPATASAPGSEGPWKGHRWDMTRTLLRGETAGAGTASCTTCRTITVGAGCTRDSTCAVRPNRRRSLEARATRVSDRVSPFQPVSFYSACLSGVDHHIVHQFCPRQSAGVRLCPRKSAVITPA